MVWLILFFAIHFINLNLFLLFDIFTFPRNHILLLSNLLIENLNVLVIFFKILVLLNLFIKIRTTMPMSGSLADYEYRCLHKLNP